MHILQYAQEVNINYLKLGGITGVFRLKCGRWFLSSKYKLTIRKKRSVNKVFRDPKRSVRILLSEQKNEKLETEWKRGSQNRPSPLLFFSWHSAKNVILSILYRGDIIAIFQKTPLWGSLFQRNFLCNLPRGGRYAPFLPRRGPQRKIEACDRNGRTYRFRGANRSKKSV